MAGDTVDPEAANWVGAVNCDPGAELALSTWDYIAPLKRRFFGRVVKLARSFHVKNEAPFAIVAGAS